MTLNDIEHELKSGKAYYFMHDKGKHPCLIVKIKNHYP